MKKTESTAVYLREKRNGPIVREYPDLKAAKAGLGIPIKHIQTIIKGRRRHDGLLVSNTPPEGPKHVPRPQVDLYLSDGSLAGTFKNQTEAALFANVSQASISRCLERPWKRAGEYYARTHGTIFVFVPTPKKTRRR